MKHRQHNLSWMRVQDGNSQAVNILAAMHDRVFSPAFERVWRADDFNEIIRMPGAEILLISTRKDPNADSLPVGFLVLSHIAGEAEILTFGIDPDFQMQGLGQQVLTAYLAQAVGVSDIFLEVRQSNHGAIKLYEKVGFIEAGRRADYYKLTNGQREGALLMHCCMAVTVQA